MKLMKGDAVAMLFALVIGVSCENDDSTEILENSGLERD